MSMHFVLERFGRVVDGGNLSAFYSGHIDSLPHKFDFGAGLGLVQMGDAMNRAVARFVAGRRITRLSVVVFGHLYRLDVDVGIRRSRVRRGVRRLVAVWVILVLVVSV